MPKSVTIQVDPVRDMSTKDTADKFCYAHTHHHIICSIVLACGGNNWQNECRSVERDRSPPLSTSYSHHSFFLSLILYISFPPSSADVSTLLSFTASHASLLYFSRVCESWLNTATISPQLLPNTIKEEIVAIELIRLELLLKTFQFNKKIT